MDAVYTRYRENPSFSSTLLDEIYRSIDERDGEQLTVCRKPKQTKFGGTDCFRDDYDERRACLIQKWMENKACEKPVVGRKSAADVDRRSVRSDQRDSLCFNSSCSSSDSSYGGGFSSSEVESMYGVLFKPSRPVRTSIHQRDDFVKREKEKSMYGHGYQLHDLEPKAPPPSLPPAPVFVRRRWRRVILDRKSKSANASTCSGVFGIVYFFYLFAYCVFSP